MKRPDQRDREIEALRERLSRLSGASLRINESLDFDTVLQEVADSARALTASRYAAITVLDEAGRLSDFIVSGLTKEEHQGLWDMPEGVGSSASACVDVAGRTDGKGVDVGPRLGCWPSRVAKLYRRP